MQGGRGIGRKRRRQQNSGGPGSPPNQRETGPPPPSSWLLLSSSSLLDICRRTTFRWKLTLTATILAPLSWTVLQRVDLSSSMSGEPPAPRNPMLDRLEGLSYEIPQRAPPTVPLIWDRSGALSAVSRIANQDARTAAPAVADAIRLRHQCIGTIRTSHRTVLGPLILGEKERVGETSGRIEEAMTRVLLVDPAYHRNVGDHMITLGEIEFVRSLCEPSQIYSPTSRGGLRHFGGGCSRGARLDQCGYVQAKEHAPPCDAFLRNKSKSKEYSPFLRKVALWHGGGNWGDLWRAMQPRRIASFEILLRNNYTVIGMPQSLFYRDPSRARQEAGSLLESVAMGLGLLDEEREADAASTGDGDRRRRWRTLDKKQVGDMARSRVYLCWREIESYEAARDLYPFVSHLLVPDIAFQLGPYEPLQSAEEAVPRIDVVLLLRDDHESTQRDFRNKAAVRNELSAIPGAERVSFRIVDWDDRLELFQSGNIFFSETSIRLLAMGRVLVCDRLHAAILCYLAGIPFVYLDQVSGKITKTLRVAFGSVDCQDGEAAMWARADNFTDALLKAVQFLDKYKLKP